MTALCIPLNFNITNVYFKKSEAYFFTYKHNTTQYAYMNYDVNTMYT